VKYIRDGDRTDKEVARIGWLAKKRKELLLKEKRGL